MNDKPDTVERASRPSAEGQQAAPRRPQRLQQAQPGPVTLDGMRQHLQGVFIGCKEGDPTLGVLPQEIPPPSQQPQQDGAATQPSKLINLREWSTEQLMLEAATTLSRDPFEDLLPNPPGVPRDRIAYVTGQQPSRRRASASGGPSLPATTATAAPALPPLSQAVVSAAIAAAEQAMHPAAGSPQVMFNGGVPCGVSSPLGGTKAGGTAGSRLNRKSSNALSDAELVQVVGRYLGGDGEGRGAVPWTELGLLRGGLMLQGRELDLRRLWKLVSEAGGFDSVTANRKWSALSYRLGAEQTKNAKGASLIKGWYHRFLLPYEQHLRETGAWGSRGQAASTAVGTPARGEAGAQAIQQLRQQQQGEGDAQMAEVPPLDVATLHSALAVAMSKV